MCIHSLSKGQKFTVNGQVINAQTQAGVPYANIKIKGGLSGLGTDSAGFFRFTSNTNALKLRISSVGFNSKEITLKSDSFTDLTIILEPANVNLESVIVKPRENTAWPILRAALKNKALHNPENAYDTYQAQLYTKINVNIGDLVKIKRKNDTLTLKDPPLRFEYAANTFYKKPNQKKEIIHAANTNFLKTYASVLLGVPLDLHMYHFYNEIYNFYPQKRIYSNPLNSQTFKQYDWELLDTLKTDKDTYILNYTPYKGSNFNGFKGQLHLSKNDYAIKYILAETSDSLQQLAIIIEHHYQKTPAGWFPKTVSTHLDLIVKADTLKGKVKADFFTAFDSVKINQPIPKNTFDGIALELKRGAENVPDSVFNRYRTKALDSLENGKLTMKKDKISKGIVAIDSKYSTQIQNLLAGVVDLGNAEILLFNAVNINRIELASVGFTVSNKYIDKPRFGIRLSPSYGILDKKFKLRSELSWFISKDRYNRLTVGYNNMYRNAANPEDVMGPNFLYPFYWQALPQNKADFNFMKINTQEGVFAQLYLKPLAHTLLKLEYQSNTNTPYNANLLGDSVKYDKKEISAHVRFAYKEKINRVGLFETAINRYFPIIYFRLSKGLSQSGYDYWKANLKQSYQIRFKRIGISEFQPSITYLAGSFNSDFLLESSENSRIAYKNPERIVTLLKTEKRQSTLTQANVYFSHDFNNALLKPKTPYTQPRIKVFYNFNISNLDFKNQKINQKTNSQYVGLQVRNLIRIPIKKFWLGLGTQVTYYFGANAPESTRERIRVGLKVF